MRVNFTHFIELFFFFVFSYIFTSIFLYLLPKNATSLIYPFFSSLFRAVYIVFLVTPNSFAAFVSLNPVNPPYE